jgi:hypothetical protein
MVKVRVILLGASLLITGLSLANSNSFLEVTDSLSKKLEEVKISNIERKEVTETINTHLNGIKMGKIELIESAWLKKHARITEIDQGNVTNKDIDRSFALWGNEPTANLNEKIISIQLTSKNVVIAQISLLWNGSIYEDTLTLIKTEKGWKIIGKIYNVPIIPKSNKLKSKKTSGGY